MSVMIELDAASAPNVWGLDPSVVTALATLALALVGVVSIGTGTALAIAAFRSNRLQRLELDALQTQLELSRQEMALRSNLTEAERQRAVQAARVNVDVNASGGSYRQGTPPHDVKATVSVVNHGPGVAAALTYGIRRGEWERAANPRPTTLGVDKSESREVPVPDEVVADTSAVNRADFFNEEFQPWVRYTDASGTRWEKGGDAPPVKVDDQPLPAEQA